MQIKGIPFKYYLRAESPGKKKVITWEESIKVRSWKSRAPWRHWQLSSWQAQTESPQPPGRNMDQLCWEKLSLNTWAKADDHLHSSREDMSSELKSLSVINAKFCVMNYERNVWKSETRWPFGIVSNPALGHTFVFLGCCSKSVFLPLKICPNTERDWP